MKPRGDHKPFKYVGVLLALAGILLSGCDRGRQPQPRAHTTPEVSIVAVKPQSVILKTELPGRTSAFRIAQIRPQVSGLILKRTFREGSDVKAGQLLYKIDPAPFQAALDNAKATLAVARKTVSRARAALAASIANVARQKATLALARENRKRFETAYKSRSVSASRRDQAVTGAQVAEATLRAYEAEVESNRTAIAAAEAAIKQAEATVKTAAINLKYARITAPISGRIGKSNVTEGAIVTAYQPIPLATIQQLDPIYVDVSQSTTELLRLKRRSGKEALSRGGSTRKKVRLILEDGTAYSLEGTLQFRDVTVDPTTGSTALRIVFPNPEDVLLPGMFVRAIIKEGVRERAILVPQQGVSRDRRGNPFVLIVNKQGRAERRLLVLGRAIGNKWLVLSGLAPGDRVIVEGLQFVRPGMPVKAVPFSLNKARRGPGARQVQPGKRPGGGT